MQSLADRISTYLSPPLFPVRLADIPSSLEFHDAPEGSISIGSLTVQSSLVTHQGPTVGYRIEEHGRSVVYLPDHEPGLGLGLAGRPVEWVSGYHLAHGADVLLHDAQYGDGEYPHHIGWGHSAIAHVVDFARMAEVDQLLLFHHDPYHCDDELESMVIEAQRYWGAGGERVQAACEGMLITFDAAGVSIDPAGDHAVNELVTVCWSPSHGGMELITCCRGAPSRCLRLPLRRALWGREPPSEHLAELGGIAPSPAHAAR